jgi:Na+-transporting methylmalonyl-CoA/oxaloacetate decarboxylase gamma subunit
MTVPESLLIAFFCMAMVFAVLAALCGLIKLFSVMLGAISNSKQPAPISVPTQPVLGGDAEFSSGVLKLRDVDEPTAAMIMAIVSDESGIPLSELCFKSIKLVRHEDSK